MKEEEEKLTDRFQSVIMQAGTGFSLIVDEGADDVGDRLPSLEEPH